MTNFTAEITNHRNTNFRVLETYQNDIISVLKGQNIIISDLKIDINFTSDNAVDAGDVTFKYNDVKFNIDLKNQKFYQTNDNKIIINEDKIKEIILGQVPLIVEKNKDCTSPKQFILQLQNKYPDLEIKDLDYTGINDAEIVPFSAKITKDGIVVDISEKLSFLLDNSKKLKSLLTPDDMLQATNIIDIEVKSLSKLTGAEPFILQLQKEYPYLKIKDLYYTGINDDEIVPFSAKITKDGIVVDISEKLSFLLDNSKKLKSLLTEEDMLQATNIINQAISIDMAAKIASEEQQKIDSIKGSDIKGIKDEFAQHGVNIRVALGQKTTIEYPDANRTGYTTSVKIIRDEISVIKQGHAGAGINSDDFAELFKDKIFDGNEIKENISKQDISDICKEIKEQNKSRSRIFQIYARKLKNKINHDQEVL